MCLAVRLRTKLRTVQVATVVFFCFTAIMVVAWTVVPMVKRSRTNAIMLQLAAERRGHMDDIVHSLMRSKEELDRFPRDIEEWFRTDPSATNLLFRPKGAQRAYSVDFEAMNRGEVDLVIPDPGIDLGLDELPSWAYWEWWPSFRIHMRLEPTKESMPFYPAPDRHLEDLGIEIPSFDVVK